MRMTLPVWTQRSLASELMEEVDRAFALTTASPGKSYDERSFHPACDITESDDQYAISVDLPGLKKEDIKIEMIGDAIIVSGERKRQTSEHKTQRYERTYGFFKRSFTLPQKIAADKVEARYEDGVLELRLPKVPEAKPRLIEIQSS